MILREDLDELTLVCDTCRRKKIKCDRQRPSCARCRKSCVRCTYPDGAGLERAPQPKSTQPTTSEHDIDCLETLQSSTSSPAALNEMTEEAGNFQFINISQPTQANDAGNRAVVRSHVMRKFLLQQKRQQAQLYEAPPANPTGRDRAVTARRLASAGLNEARLQPFVSWGNGSGPNLDPFDSLIVPTTRPQVRELLNHAAGYIFPMIRPIGKSDPWKAELEELMRSDELFFHSSLYHAAVHLAIFQPQKYSLEVTLHFTQTLQILNKRLRDPTLATTCAAFQVVNGMLGRAVERKDIKEIQAHADGLQRMVKLAGGLEHLGLNGLLQELIYWVDLSAAVVAKLPPRYPHPTTVPMINYLILFTAPGSKLDMFGQGFSRDLNFPEGLVSGLLELVNQVRSLAQVNYYAAKGGMRRISVPSYHQRGQFIKQRLLGLPNPFTLANGCTYHLFECCRYSSIVFTELLLHGVQSPSISPELEIFTLELLKVSQGIDLTIYGELYSQFFLWLFSMGAIASAQDVSMRHFFLMSLRQVLPYTYASTWQEAKQHLMRYLWAVHLLDGVFERLWADLVRRNWVRQ